MSYDANGGSGDQLPGAVETTAHAPVEVDFSVQPGRPGYQFLGWDEDPLSSNARYPAGGNASLTMPEGDLTLYAVWKIDEAQTATAAYTVHYYVDGALQPDWSESYSKTTLVADDPAPAYVVDAVTDHLADLGADYYTAFRPDLPATLSGEGNVLEVRYAHKLVDVAGTGIKLSHNYVYKRVIDGETSVNNFSRISSGFAAQPGSLLRLQDLMQTVDPEGNTAYEPTGAAVTRTRLPLVEPETETAPVQQDAARQALSDAEAALAQAQAAREEAQQNKTAADEALAAAQAGLTAAQATQAGVDAAAVEAARQQLQELAAREGALSEEELALKAQLQGIVDAGAAADTAAAEAQALADQRSGEAQAATDALAAAESRLAEAQQALSGAQQALAAAQSAVTASAAAATPAVGESETVALNADGTFLYEAGYTYQVRLDYAKTYVYNTPVEPEEEIVSPEPNPPVVPAPVLPVLPQEEPAAQTVTPAVVTPPAAGTVAISDDDVPLGSMDLRGKSRVRRGSYVILDESVPLGSLPKTSGSMDASWGALGAFLLAAGAALGLKGKRKEQ